ncbi:hypothetical protein JCM6882_009553 [Rhodosporidiobolus microsporus]
MSTPTPSVSSSSPGGSLPSEELPALPELRINSLHHFLHWSVFFYLLPFIPYPLDPDPVVPPAAPSDIPRWTAWLERWYQIFHPATWTVLEQDEDADVAKMQEIGPLWDAAIEEEGESSRRATRLEELMRKLYQRCEMRFHCLFGLHFVRKIYLERKQEEYLALSKTPEQPLSPKELEREILRGLLEEDSGSLPKFAPGSVWPFSISPPKRKTDSDPPAPTHSLEPPPPPRPSAYLPSFLAKHLQPPNPDAKQFYLPERNVPEAWIAAGEAQRPDRPPSSEKLPSLPELRVISLHRFLPWSVLFYLLPFIPYSLDPDPIVPRAAPSDIPRWTAWLERWYQVFHPATWTTLEQDNDADAAKMQEFGPLWFEAIEEDGEESKRATGLEQFMRKLYERCETRFHCLLGLHVVRKIYLERKQKEYRSLSKTLEQPMSPKELEEEILGGLLEGGTDGLPDFAPGSVWPFSIPPPKRKTDSDLPAPTHSLEPPPPPRSSAYLPTFLSKHLQPPDPDAKHFYLPERNIPEAWFAAGEAQRRKDARNAAESGGEQGRSSAAVQITEGGNVLLRRIARQVSID